MKDKDINSAEESELLEEDSTLKGEFITSYFAWVPLNEQKEKVKATVRKLKEYQLELELLPPDTFIKTRNMTAVELVEYIDDRIKPWEKYGAKYW